MFGRTLFAVSLFLGSIVATPVADATPGSPLDARAVNVARVAEVAAPAFNTRELDYDEMIDTAAGWGREYLAIHYPATAHAGSLHRRDFNTTEIFDTIIAWMKNWLHDYESGSSSSSTNGTVISRRELDLDEIVTTLATWAKDYLRSDGATLSARDVALNKSLDRVAEKVKRWMHGDIKLFARDGSTSILGQIIDALINITEQIFGTDNLGSILSTIISWLAKLA